MSTKISFANTDPTHLRAKLDLTGGLHLWSRGNQANPLCVNSDDFSDAALVVLGHGTDLNAASAASVFQHAAELRRRHLFRRGARSVLEIGAANQDGPGRNRGTPDFSSRHYSSAKGILRVRSSRANLVFLII